ncbi:DUF7661 family protein [Photobacterium sanguinicancri]|uniref:DUF7661 family protein n=1 Tax=Photobacterium sanguinicancri TaxID=875932 RepID=UPI003D14976A
MRIKFNVFGKVMSVQRKNEEWLLFRESETSMRVRIYDVVIPSDLPAEFLAQYLADIFHEQASEYHTGVKCY